MNNNKNFRKTFIKLVQAILATATVMIAFMSPAFAAPKVEITGAGYGGSGCPRGTASVTIRPNGQELTILFDKFIALGNKPNESRKSCNLSIPIKVPQGYQVSLYNANYQGYVAPATTGKIRAEYFFAGGRGPIFSRQFSGKTNYNFRDRLTNRANVWSRCGDSVNMRVNAAMTARGQGMATVERIGFLLRSRRC
jgi:Domain of unknown function (DUF4360)